MRIIRTMLFLSTIFILNACLLTKYNDDVSTQTGIPVDQILEKIGDGGIISENPCGPPCFVNITPKKTTDEQATNILDQMGWTPYCEPLENYGVGFKCVPFLTITFKKHVVDEISFLITVDITVDDVIKKYGFPDSIYINTWEEDHGNKLFTAMHLLYDANNITYLLFDQESDTYNLSPESLVMGVNYSNEETYLMQKGPTQNWNDYGSYKE